MKDLVLALNKSPLSSRSKQGIKSTFLALAILLSSWAQGQTAEALTEAIAVNFEVANSPSIVSLTKPEGISEVTRGFKKVEGEKIEFAGVIFDQQGVKQALLNNLLLNVHPSTGQFSMTLDLQEGQHNVEFKVTDVLGQVTTKVFALEVGKREVASSSATTEVLNEEAGRYYALLIGVDEYEDPAIIDLLKPVADATALRNALVANYTFAEGDVKLLVNAKRRDIIDALDQLRAKVKPVDNVLIFYAGHGYWEEQNEIGYWIPSDAQKGSTADWFRNSTLTDQIRTIRSKHTLLVADACFSGSIFRARAFMAEAPKDIRETYRLPSRKAMTSGTLTEVPDRSAFIQYLVKRLEDNNDKYMSAGELFYRMRSAVINNSDVMPQFGTIQKVGDEGGDFVFIRKD